MGMPNSKFGKEIEKNELHQGSLPSTPILTPKAIKLSGMDPRSPSLHIARTPLELLSAAAEKLELLDDTPVRNKRPLLGIDPRSPTTDFKRTPIIVNSADGEFPIKLHNKNFDKALQSELRSAFSQCSEQSTVSPKYVIPPKLLQSSPIKPRSDAYKRRSLVGLLETNIDFTETDLDRVLQAKCKIENMKEKNMQNDTMPENIETVIKVISSEQNYLNIPGDDLENIVPTGVENMSKRNESEAKPEEQIVSVISEDNISEAEIAHNTPQDIEINKNMEQIEVCREDGDVLENIDEVVNNAGEEENELALANEIDNETVNQIPNEIKSAPVTPPSIPLSPILSSKHNKSAPVTPPLVNLTADVKELDKKLTNLIYEDDLVVCPRIVKLKDTTERSPLRNCNGNEPRAKSAQKLKVSDKPRRSEYVVSRIPVFKEKKAKISKGVQCENTPPRNMEMKKIRHRRSDWDTKDSTLYL